VAAHRQIDVTQRAVVDGGLRKVAGPSRLLWRHRQLGGTGSLCPRRQKAADEVAQSTGREAALELGEVRSDGTAISIARFPGHGPSAHFLVKGLARSRVRK